MKRERWENYFRCRVVRRDMGGDNAVAAIPPRHSSGLARRNANICVNTLKYDWRSAFSAGRETRAKTADCVPMRRDKLRPRWGVQHEATKSRSPVSPVLRRRLFPPRRRGRPSHREIAASLPQRLCPGGAGLRIAQDGIADPDSGVPAEGLGGQDGHPPNVGLWVGVCVHWFGVGLLAG